MPSAPRFDLVLFGYRNDLARERVLAYLAALPEASGGPVRLARDQILPHPVLRDLDHEVGLRLLAVLRDRGAQVRLEAGADEVHPPSPPDAPSPPPAAPPSPHAAQVRLAWLVLALLLAGTAYVRFGPLPRPLPPPRLPGSDPTSLGERLDPAPHRLNDEAVELNADGRFADAADRLRAALAGAPTEPALRRNLKTVLHNWAVAELNANRTASAVALLEEGLTLEEDAHLLSALGIARARRGEWQDARGVLERALALGAADPYTLTALGKVYRQQGDRTAAVEMFHRARDQGADGADFRETLVRLERELDAEWDFAEMRSPHFQIAFAAGEQESDAAAQVVARELEDAYFHVGAKFDLYPEERIPVVLYPSAEFHDVTQTPSWTSGVYDGRIKLPVGGISDSDPAVLARTLRHEYAHVVIHRLTHGRCPVWLNEGAAIWAEEAADGEREEWAHRTLAGEVLFPLANLAGSFTRLPAERVPVAYAQSYLTVRSLVDGAGNRRLRELLTGLGDGRSLAAAFRETFYGDLAAFESDFIRQLTEG